MKPESFWHAIDRPVSVLAPMEDVTDTVFRDIIVKAGRPDVFFTEFVATGALSRGEREALRRLEFNENHRPMVAQIWGNNPELYYKAALEIHRRGYDGIDINMGCPQKKITSKGCCSALINNPSLAKELVLAAKEGAEAAWAQNGDTHEGPDGKVQANGALPVSVKTRIGFSNVQTEQWTGFLLGLDLPVLTVHGRTAAQQSEGLADWSEIHRVSKLRRTMSPQTLVFGNGDINEPGQIEAYARQYELDGIMVGRGIFHNPFIFSGDVFRELEPEVQIRWAVEHLELYRQTYEGRRNFEIMKKFFKVYIMGFPGADELRDEIMQTHDYEAARGVLLSFPRG